MRTPDYKSFARDMMKLCKKHNVKLIAYGEGFVGLGPAEAKVLGDFIYDDLEFSPKGAKIGDIEIKK